jgi:hypothetical protein
MNRKFHKINDWIRRQKIKYLNKQGGPAVPNETTELYFDWRKLRAESGQNHYSIHPGIRMYK